MPINLLNSFIKLYFILYMSMARRSRKNNNFFEHKIIFLCGINFFLFRVKQFFVQHQLVFVNTGWLIVQHQTFCFNTKLLFMQHQTFVLNIVQNFTRTAPHKKVENSMALSNVLNGYTSVFLYSRYSSKLPFCTCCTKKCCVAQKTMLCQQKRIFHIEVMLPTKNIWVTKKYVVAIKKNHVTPKKETHVD